MKTITILSSTLFTLALASNSFAVTSAEIYTADAYQYGRFSARIQFAPGSGVVSSFFLWKDGSGGRRQFWNELDFEKLEAECRVETNTIYGNPVGLHSQAHDIDADLCGSYHVYVYEWTPEYLLWTVDGVEIRRETGDVVQAYAQNTAAGMQLRFNVWPGDETFGGVFNPSILPVYQYIDWIEYSTYTDGNFEVLWRDDFTEPNLSSRWSTASWDSPKGNSIHAASNAVVRDGYAVLALTADDATGIGSASPRDSDTETDPTGTTMPEPSTTTSAPPTTTSASEGSSTAPQSTDETSSAPSDGTSTQSDASAAETTVTDSVTAPSSDTTAQPTSAASTSTAPSQAPDTTVGSDSGPVTTTASPTSPQGSTATNSAASSDAPGDEPSVETTPNASGCGCRVGTQRSSKHSVLVFAVGLAMAMTVRCRRRAHRRDA